MAARRTVSQAELRAMLRGRPASPKKKGARKGSGTSPLVERLALQLSERGAPVPAFEYRFHPRRRWRFDLAWPELRIAVEVEGGLYTGGRQGERSGIGSGGHVRGAGYERNCEKYNAAVALGWRVLRGGPKMVASGALARATVELVRASKGSAR